MDNRFAKKKILLLEGYGRQILPYLKEYKKLGCETTVLCGSKLDLAYVSKYSDHRLLGICDMERYEESEKFIVNAIKTGNFDIVVPMGDFAAKILSKNKDKLQQYARIAVNEYKVFNIALDKLKVMDICMKNNIPCPKTLMDISTAGDVIDAGLSYPFIIKPRSDCGARGFNIFYNKKEFLDSCASIKLDGYVIQEYIPQTDKNMSVGLFIDNQGKLKSSYVYRSCRWYPLKGGTGTLNELVDRSDVVKVCYKLARIIGLTGTIGFDLIDDPRDNIPKIIEINPRVLACAKIGFEAGINQAVQLLEKEYGYPVTCFKVKKKQLYVRMSQIDILWFLKSHNRFNAKPSYFQIRHVKDQTFSFADPLPWFAFLLRGLHNLKKEEAKRK